MGYNHKLCGSVSLYAVHCKSALLGAFINFRRKYKMRAHELRVIEENKELETKLLALNEFICLNPVFEDLTRKEKQLLREQAQVMGEYSDILKERIKAFNLISDCGCRFENDEGNSVVLCEACSELPCHNA